MLSQVVNLIPRTAARDYLLDVAYGVRHPTLFQSGATLEETRRHLPGDHLVANPMWQATRAVTIHAPAERVWPWVAQMGWGRGGWYWWADSLVEDEMSPSRILPHFQSLKVGDVLLDGPGCDRTRGAWAVRGVDAGRNLILYSVRDPFTGLEIDPEARPHPYIDCSWTFVLEPIDARTTRLLARTRARFGPAWMDPVARLLGAADTVMQRTLMDGIRERSERAPQRVHRAAPGRTGPEGRHSATPGTRARPTRTRASDSGTTATKPRPRSRTAIP
jgi:hypothetical protein